MGEHFAHFPRPLKHASLTAMTSILPHAFADQLTILLFAWVLSAVWYLPPAWEKVIAPYHPKRLFNLLAERLDARLNRTGRDAGSLRARGGFSFLMLWLLSLVLFSMLASFVSAFDGGVFFEVVVLAAMMPIRPLWRRVQAFAVLTQVARAEEISKAVTMITRQFHIIPDRHGAIRLVMEELACALAERLLLQGMMYLLLGLPGLGVAWLLVWLSHQWSVLDKKYQHFGAWVARVLAVAGWLPQRIAATFLMLAALFASGARPLKAFSAWLNMKTDVHNLPAVQVLAAACGVALGGKRVTNESLESRKWTGDGTAQVTVADLQRAGRLYLIAAVCLALSVACWRLALFA